MIHTPGKLIDTLRGMSRPGAFSYSPYGYAPRSSSLLGFNGERLDPCTRSYLLGNGYRLFNPTLIRFSSPDSASPFEHGGLNPYGYCKGDPINTKDPSGHAPMPKHMNRYAPRYVPRYTTRYAPQNSPRYVPQYAPRYAPRHVSQDVPQDVPQGYDFVGYHGSTLTHQSSLEVSVEPMSNPYTNHGDGFYFTQRYNLAWSYARRTARREGRASTPHVFGVYVKNFRGLKAGTEIVNLWDGSDERVMESYLIREPAFNQVIVRKAAGFSPLRRNSFVEYPSPHPHHTR